MHSEHLANTNDSKSLSDHSYRFGFSKKTIATELRHYLVILHHQVFDNIHTRYLSY